MSGIALEALHSRFLRFTLLGIIFATSLIAQPRTPIPTGKGVPLSPEEAATRLHQFRHQPLTGDFTFQFELEHMPRRGESRVFKGLLWGTWNQFGPLMRARFSATEGVQVGKSIEMILQNGTQPSIWQRHLSSSLNNPPTQHPPFTNLTSQNWFKEILPGVGYVPFDLLMPFSYWPDTRYIGPEKVKGRPAHIFQATPPIGFRGFESQFKLVRYALDDSYNALLRVEILGPLDKPLRTFKILSFKKLEDEQWIIKTIDLVNEISRDKARFQVTAAAVGNKNPDILFDYRQTFIPQPDKLKRL